ncbi:MFS transporter [Domibacillus enclensis]|uniref:MFS transporter, DHA1 family, multidrug resistance protein n=1 Tax=Domibacillus enclensis TaxID=1017273 RepID=A0A1N6NCC8_9BACI|nr:tetracycline resistance MFS efflux pump [Domibacillus enclensis]OXS80002.1 tetracycline resistance MFS efflux pump [Domibacillus enclensis]SIP89710.1 MFS transporter, DHA1 family, multidrug resistance protein [Domibacillus enclensis]
MTRKNIQQFPLLILMLNMFIVMTGIGLVIPIMPTIIHDFGAGGKTFGFLIATFAFAQFLFSPLAGDLSDRYGRKKSIVFGLILFSSAQFLFAFSNHLALLYVSRLIGGIGGAFLIPSIMAFVADITTVETRAKGMGRLGAAMSFGFVVGPGAGGFLAAFGLRAPFIIAGTVAALAALLSIFFLKEPVKEAVQSATKQRESLLKQLTLSIKKPYFILLVMMFTLSFGLSNYQSTISLFTDEKFGFSPSDISILMVTGGLVGVIVQAFVLNRVLERFGEVRIMNTMLVVAAISMVGILFATGFVSVLAISAVFFTAASLLRPSINTTISKMAGNEQGFAAGMNNAYMSIGNMIGPALAGTLFDINMGLPYVFGAVIIGVTLFICIRWARGKRHQVASSVH